MPGVTLDAGALIAIERGDRRMQAPMWAMILLDGCIDAAVSSTSLTTAVKFTASLCTQPDPPPASRRSPTGDRSN